MITCFYYKVNRNTLCACEVKKVILSSGYFHIFYSKFLSSWNIHVSLHICPTHSDKPFLVKTVDTLFYIHPVSGFPSCFGLSFSGLGPYFYSCISPVRDRSRGKYRCILFILFQKDLDKTGTKGDFMVLRTARSWFGMSKKGL